MDTHIVHLSSLNRVCSVFTYLCSHTSKSRSMLLPMQREFIIRGYSVLVELRCRLAVVSRWPHFTLSLRSPWLHPTVLSPYALTLTQSFISVLLTFRTSRVKYAALWCTVHWEQEWFSTVSAVLLQLIRLHLVWCSVWWHRILLYVFDRGCNHVLEKYFAFRWFTIFRAIWLKWLRAVGDGTHGLLGGVSSHRQNLAAYGRRSLSKSA